MGWAASTFKSVYFVHTRSPLQFLVCGAIQLTLDGVILIQYCLFRRWHSPLPVSAEMGTPI